MTAAEILRSAKPPGDDGLIEKAIADLDTKIWEWADALKSAHAQLRSAFAVLPTPRPSASLYDNVIASLPAAAAAAHVPTPPPMPAEWTAPPAPVEHDWAQHAQQFPQVHGGHGLSAGPTTPQPAMSSSLWGQAPAPGQHAFQPAEGSAPTAGQGTMQWPTAPGSNWPDAAGGSASTGPQAWPTWTPTDTSASATSSGHANKSAGGSGVRATRAPKAVRPVVEGPTAEERAQKAAAEEALLSGLEESIARRVRLLRRLDPDTAIEKLIDKAKQGHAEAAASAPAKDDKSSSWWRRK